MKSEREIQIDTYIKEHPDAKQDGAEPLVIHGQRQELPVFRLPTKFLVFNIKNGRFAAEALAEERRLKRHLDPTKPDDIKIIQGLLLGKKPDETEALKKDLKKNGQLRSGIITADGAVINANRRLAILQSLEEEDEKFAYITVARLPRGIDEKDLWKIEANLQFGHDFRIDYGPVNELLKIKAGHDSGLSEKQIAEPTSGRYTENDIKEKLRILKLIDSYLQFIGKPGEYRLIQDGRHVEKFNSLQSNVIAPLERTWGKKTEIPKIITAAFGLVRGDDTTHWQIRKLKKIAQLEPARLALYKAFEKNGTLSKNNKTITEAFNQAEFIVDLDKDRPDKVAEKALSLLQDIEKKHPLVGKANFQETLRNIIAEVERLSSSKKMKKNATR